MCHDLARKQASCLTFLSVPVCSPAGGASASSTVPTPGSTAAMPGPLGVSLNGAAVTELVAYTPRPELLCIAVPAQSSAFITGTRLVQTNA